MQYLLVSISNTIKEFALLLVFEIFIFQIFQNETIPIKRTEILFDFIELRKVELTMHQQKVIFL